MHVKINTPIIISTRKSEWERLHKIYIGSDHNRSHIQS